MEGQNYKEQFIPLFPFSEPNKSAVVGKDEILIKDKNGNVLHSGNAEFRLDFLPKPQIHVYVTNKKELNDSEKSGLHVLYDKILVENLFEMTSKKSGNKFKGFVINSDLFDPSGPSLTFTPSSEPIVGLGDKDTQMQYVIFHLFNFREICANKGRYCEDVRIEADNWIIEIKSLAKSENNFKKLKKEGGYGLTHIVCLQQIDSTFFSGKEAIEMLNMLQYFFSFANGAWCNPICAVGFNSTDRVWESWSSPRGPSFSRSESWFDEHHSEQLENLFPGFMNNWSDEGWNDAIQKAIYWYLISNNSQIDAGIILTQNALERLSFEYAVLKRKLISADSFTKLKASDKFKLLFSSLELSIGIRKDLSDFEKIAKAMKWDDATHGMSEVRNSLVHPNPKNKGKFKSVYYDTWKLGQWYLELSLLKLCNYSGTYCNRLTTKWVGEVEKVPWEK